VRKTIAVTLQALPAARALASGDDSSSANDDAGNDSAASVSKLGITVAPVDQDDVQQLRLAPDQRGALVTDVTAGGPSYGELVDPDHGGPDIITEVEGKAIHSPADLRNALSQQKPGSIVSLRVYNARTQSRRVERIKLGE
jgi:S1-C subfamily serine protease